MTSGLSLRPAKGDLTLRKKADSREVRLKIDIEWLQLKTTGTVEHRLNAIGLIAFLAWSSSDRLSATSQEVVTRLEVKIETGFYRTFSIPTVVPSGALLYLEGSVQLNACANSDAFAYWFSS